MCSIIGVGERLHKVLGQIDLGTLDSGERSLPFGLLVLYPPQTVFVGGEGILFSHCPSVCLSRPSVTFWFFFNILKRQ